MIIFASEGKCTPDADAHSMGTADDFEGTELISGDETNSECDSKLQPNLELVEDYALKDSRGDELMTTISVPDHENSIQEVQDCTISAGSLKLEETCRIENYPNTCTTEADVAANASKADEIADINDVEYYAAKPVLVTGAGGFIASWIIMLLLKRGCCVRGTLRDIGEEKTAHLRKMEGADERLELVKADIMDYSSVQSAVKNCQGVFHIACPVPPVITDPEVQMINPAVEGTLNVLKACSQAHVKRVVLTSSIGAVYIDPSRPSTQIIDESCWSDEMHLREIKEWYCLAKLMAERAAWAYAKSHKVDLVSICPAVTMGTMLEPNVNQSSTHILKFLNGSATTYSNLYQAYTDVEDAAEAHLLAYETPTASGRYLCAKWSLHRSQLVDTLRRVAPNYPVPTRCKDDPQPRKVPLKFSSKKVEELGLKFTSLEETLVKAVASLEAKGCIQRTITVVNHPSSGKQPITIVPKSELDVPNHMSFDVASPEHMVRDHDLARHDVQQRHHRRINSLINFPQSAPIVLPLHNHNLTHPETHEDS